MTREERRSQHRCPLGLLCGWGPGCDGFFCDACGEEKCWIDGASDERPDTCDDCWDESHEKTTAHEAARRAR